MMGHAIGNSALPITNMNMPNGTQTGRLMNLGGAGIFAAAGNGGLGATGGLVMSGSGTLLVDGPSNSYSGGTTINSGRLVAVSALPAGGTVNVSGGTLAGTSSDASNVTLTTGIIAPGPSPVDGSVGTLTMDTLTANGGTMRFDLSTTPGGTDLIKVLGLASFNGSATTITPVFAGASQNGSYTLLTANALGGTAPAVNVPSNNTRTQYTVHFGDVVANAITLDVSGQAATLTWTGTVDAGGGTFVWDVKNTPNWTSSAATNPNIFFDLDTVNFDDTGTAHTVTINGTVSPAAVNIANSTGHDYTFTGTGAIGGPGSLTKSGTGAATLLTNNTYSGPTTVNGGLLFINGNQSVTGANIVNAGTLIINGNETGAGTTAVSGGR